MRRFHHRRTSSQTRCDILINIQHGMGIKMNIHRTRPMPTNNQHSQVPHDSWKQLARHNAREFSEAFSVSDLDLGI
jgi:hypothetical protein